MNGQKGDGYGLFERRRGDFRLSLVPGGESQMYLWIRDIEDDDFLGSIPAKDLLALAKAVLKESRRVRRDP